MKAVHRWRYCNIIEGPRPVLCVQYVSRYRIDTRILNSLSLSLAKALVFLKQLSLRHDDSLVHAVPLLFPKLCAGELILFPFSWRCSTWDTLRPASRSCELLRIGG